MSAEVIEQIEQTDTRSTMPTDSVRAYLQEAGRLPLLCAQQEVLLAQAIEAGVLAGEALVDRALPDDEDDLRMLVIMGEQAQHRLIQSNLRLVVSIAKRYTVTGVPLLDLVQEGNLGLMRAVQGFDHRRGFRFSTYATWFIRQAISRSVAEQATIRIPLQVADEIQRTVRAQRELAQALQRTPTLDELAASLDVSVRRVRDLLTWAQQPTSLHATAGSNGDGVLADVLCDDTATAMFHQVEHESIRDEIAAALAALNDRDRRLLLLRYGLHDGHSHTLEQIGATLGISHQRVRQLEEKALAKLRRTPRADALLSYLH